MEELEGERNTMKCCPLEIAWLLPWTCSNCAHLPKSKRAIAFSMNGGRNFNVPHLDEAVLAVGAI